VDVPAYLLMGSEEIDGNAVDSIVRPGWRLVPFQRLPGTRDAFQTVLDGLDHSDLWSTGSPEVEAFVAGEVLEFLRVYVAGEAGRPCDIGVGGLTTATTERRPAASGSRIAGCP
jgi:hypothetical protein